MLEGGGDGQDVVAVAILAYSAFPGRQEYAIL